MKVAIFGGGKIGTTIASMLTDYTLGQAYQVTLGEKNPDRLADLHEIFAEKIAAGTVTLVQLFGHEHELLLPLIRDADLLVNAGPHYVNTNLIDVAAISNVHYLDLTEDVESAKYAVERCARDSAFTKAIISQCGLAPGYIAILANDLGKKFDKVTDMRLRVGALPQNPDNRLKYNITWSVDGLINEYLNPGKAIRRGVAIHTEPLGDLEQLSINGVDYEAFNTSGGVGRLAEFWPDVENLDYKTLRYPGHNELIKFLVDDLGMRYDREFLTRLFDDELPRTYEDVVVTQVVVEGLIGTEFVRKVHAKVIKSDETYTAIQKTTAAGACAVIELLRTEKISASGFVPVELVNFKDFSDTWFYKTYYA